MVFDIRTKLNFLYLENLLFLFCFLITFLLFISVFAIIHNTAYWRMPVWSNFHEIKAFFFSQTDRFMKRHDPQLFVCIADNTNLSGPYFFIDTEFLTYSFHPRNEIIK